MPPQRTRSDKPGRTQRRPADVRRRPRAARNGHRGAVFWLTALPGAGKSTIAYATDKRLYDVGMRAAVLDGGNMRLGLCADLGFSIGDRHENVRRIAKAAALLPDQRIIVLAALVSPTRAARELARQRISPADCFEVYSDCPLPVCQRRDPKGLMRRRSAARWPNSPMCRRRTSRRPRRRSRSIPRATRRTIRPTR
ncbi:adenylyl-sulfate kinase [Paraburkholderia caballeronis]|uniref:adenylyl-sulfate kinase n=1 Tax=Paraburkholderia caballeronis TaxID=416943 RepID=UPI0015A6924C